MNHCENPHPRHFERSSAIEHNAKRMSDDSKFAQYAELEGLWAKGATVTAHDPVAMKETKHIYGERADLRYAETPLDALQDADALIIVTEWKAYKSPDFDAVKSKLKNAIIFDGRNLFEPQDIKALGIEYYGIGRGN